MPIDSALIHRARLVTQTRGQTRNAQGEYPLTRSEGPWFDARVMRSDRGGSPRQSVAGVEAGRTAVGYQVLAGPEDENGDPVLIPASGWIETDCPVLDSPTIVIGGAPEPLNNGEELIGWLVEGDVVQDVP